MPSDDLEKALTGTTGPDRIARATGVIARHAEAAGVRPVVVSGGAAVILLTALDFATRDIDLVTDRADDLAPVLGTLGFERRNPVQHQWLHPSLDVIVQVVASFLPPHSDTETVLGPSGERIAVWSATDLLIDRLAQVSQGEAERLAQAVAIRAIIGEELDEHRARQRAADDGVEPILAAFVDLYSGLANAGDDPAPATTLTERFWAQIASDPGAQR